MTAKSLLCLLPAAAALLLPPGAAARDDIRIVGSMDVLAFAEPAARRFALNQDREPPHIEITGAGAGFERFCAGVGYEHPDINATSRRITPGEIERCRRNGVEGVTEIAFGLEALVVAGPEGPADRLGLTPRRLFEALASEVDARGRLAANPHRRWRDLDGALPQAPIRVMGPAPGSPAQEGFFRMVMAAGCRGLAAVEALAGPERERTCRRLRRDGPYLDGPKSEAAILDWLRGEPGALAVVSHGAFERHGAGLVAQAVDGALPTAESIAGGGYPLARPMYLYVKTRHVDAVPGLQALLYELTSEHSIGPEGYLAERGLLPLDDRGRNRARDLALSLRALGPAAAGGR